MKFTKRTILATVASFSLLTATACGNVTGGSGEDAGSYPTKPITLTVGQSPGGSTDLIARAVADGATDALGVSMVVENKPGANGAVATKEVANKEADGYNLILLNASLITITSMIAGENEKVSLDDLDVIGGISQDDYIMVANSSSELNSIEDLVNTDREITYGTAGVGTGSQLAQLLLMGEAGVEGNEIPFDSGAPALTAVMGNQVEVATIQVGEAMPQIDAGTVKPLATFSPERLEFLPDVPTVEEAGFDIPVSQYRALAMPAGAPEEVMTTLREGLKGIFETEDYKEFNQQNYLTPHEISGEEIEQEWTELQERYQSLVVDNGINLKK